MTSKKKNYATDGTKASKQKLNVEALLKSMEINPTYEWRVKQLKTVKRMLIDHKREWTDAVYQDLHKDPTETELAEISTAAYEIDHLLKNLKQWMEPQYVPSPALFAIGFSSVMRKPLGKVLIIAPFNYPILLALAPLVGSLAGGNSAVIKPSELCPTVSALLARLVSNYFEPNAVQVVQGSVPEVTEFLKHQWGKVVFTGSERVGKIVAQATAKTLTPTVLELGGKSPVFVDETCPNDICGVANRIVWGKTFNTGQTCVAPDYVVCHEKHADALCKELVKTMELQFGKNPRESELGRIVTPTHAQRLVDMLKEVEKSQFTKILCGGSDLCDVDQCYVCPTLILNPPRGCRLLHEEIFGPILPIVTMKSREEAIDFIRNEQYGTPLALYVFTKSEQIYQDIIQAIPSGAACRNELLMHAASSHLPFGGLGTSGYGTYHGKYSFETFTHAFGSMYRPCFPGSDLGMLRCHPYKGFRRAALLDVLAKIPDIPVLHIRRVTLVLSVLLVLNFVSALDPWKKMAWREVGNLLQEMADWARSSSN